MRATSPRRRILPRVLAVLAATAALAVVVPLATGPLAHAADPVVLVHSTFDDGTSQGWTARAATARRPTSGT